MLLTILKKGFQTLKTNFRLSPFHSYIEIGSPRSEAPLHLLTKISNWQRKFERDSDKFVFWSIFAYWKWLDYKIDKEILKNKKIAGKDSRGRDKRNRRRRRRGRRAAIVLGLLAIALMATELVASAKNAPATILGEDKPTFNAWDCHNPKQIQVLEIPEQCTNEKTDNDTDKEEDKTEKLTIYQRSKSTFLALMCRAFKSKIDIFCGIGLLNCQRNSENKKIAFSDAARINDLLIQVLIYPWILHAFKIHRLCDFHLSPIRISWRSPNFEKSIFAIWLDIFQCRIDCSFQSGLDYMF